jgi:hypothetical protein
LVLIPHGLALQHGKWWDSMGLHGRQALSPQRPVNRREFAAFLKGLTGSARFTPSQKLVWSEYSCFVLLGNVMRRGTGAADGRRSRRTH